MSRRLHYIVIFLFLTLASGAQDVSDSQVLKTASAFIHGYLGKSDIQVTGINNLDFGNGPYMSVVSLSPEGWLLMSRDYSALPVIAFSLRGDLVIPATDPTDNLYEFISGYERQLKAFTTEKSSFTDPRWDPSFYYTKSAQGVADATVSPLIKVTWNQGSGWNRFCPVDEDGPGGHTYAGCVAVSMAQAMSVFQIPTTGVGSKSYIHPVYGYIFADFGSTNYNWPAMSSGVPDDYNSLLIYHCAVAVSMDFGPDGSGTRSTAPAINALKQYFGYSQRIIWSARVADTQEWKALIDKSLIAGRPIIYSGAPLSGSTGHAFNIDGVFKSNYYHVNWGWSGVSDGYYTIDNLKPGTSDFTNDQAAVFNIQPYYYPTGVALSDTLVLLSQPAGKAVGKFSIIDEAADNTYSIALECDSTFTGTERIPDYYLDGDSLRAARTFERIDGPVDTVAFIVSDAHNNHIRATRLLLLTASLSVPENLSDGDFSIFPVPANDHIILDLPAVTTRITITDLSGNRLADITPDAERMTIPVSKLSPGLYVVTVVTVQGRHYSKTFVKN